MKREAALVVGAILAASCAGADAPERAPVGSATATSTAEAALPATAAPEAPSAAASASAPGSAAPQPYVRAVRETLERVSKFRKLPIKSQVKSFVLSRDQLRDKTKQKLAEEVPPGVIELQAEGLRAFGLIPTDYDLEAGFLKLVTARVAGFYDPDTKEMYLLDDLSPSQQEETLPHELVHALQDQSFDLEPMLKYKPGKSDRTSAIQHLVEGDATLAGLMITYGSDFDPDPDAMRTAFLLSTQMSEVGAETPPIIVEGLVSPYTDGVEFVRAMRAQGGFSGIDAAFEKLPETTEQTLHPDKYLKGEKALAVPAITTEKLEKLAVGFDDVNGELGLRLMLGQWTPTKVAVKAADGWGGDRLVVARGTDDPKLFAVALYTKMDTVGDAKEFALVLRKKFGTQCLERKDLGPLAWTIRGSDVVMVAGPYKKTSGGAVSAGKCAGTEAWLKSILEAK